RALATLTGTVVGDPRTVAGRFGPQVLVRVSVGRHQPVLVFGDDDWRGVAMGERVRFTGRLGPSDDGDLAALVTPRGPPEVVARWVGVRGRWLGLVGVAGIVGFVLLARTEPSVLRAAAMGTVALVGLGRGGWHRGVRGLGVAVVGLLLLDPGLGVTAGFALS